MTLTREQLADLRPGDVVEVVQGNWSAGTTLRGPLRGSRTGTLHVGDVVVRRGNEPPPLWANFTVTVVSRAPRPVYVNHLRTQTVPGDVVRDADDEANPNIWVLDTEGSPDVWIDIPIHVYRRRNELPARLRLLVDGETGQAVDQ